MEKEYVVIVHKGVDLTAFDAELAAATGDSPIPNRAVQVANPREGSKRMTHWMLTDEEAETLKSDQRVLAVEIPPEQRDDIEIVIDGRRGKGGKFKRRRGTAKTADDVNWGLVRSNARTNVYFAGENVQSSLENDYVFALDGADVDIVIQDTGIQADHPEFEDENGNSRLQQIDWYAESGISGTQHADHYTDTDGHGTHVAAVAAGKTYGWAKGAHIYAQKISDFGGTGGISLGTDPTTAFDMIRLWHNAKTSGRPTVVNMSWGVRTTKSETPTSGTYRGQAWTYTSQTNTQLWNSYGIVPPMSNGSRSIPAQIVAYDVEVEEMIDAGIHVCISAGNNYYKADVFGGPDYNNSVVIDGTTYTYHRPASPYHEDAFFVGNISSEAKTSGGSTDFPNPNSARGPAVNVWAPGTDIMSAASNTVSSSHSDVFDYPDDPNYKIMSISGTSQASPQVAGVAALHLQSQPYLKPARLLRKLTADAVEDIIENTSNDDDYDTSIGSLTGGANRFLRSRYGVESPFSIVVPVTDTGDSSSGVDTGDTGLQDSDSGSGGSVVDAVQQYAAQIGLEFVTQSGDSLILDAPEPIVNHADNIQLSDWTIVAGNVTEPTSETFSWTRVGGNGYVASYEITGLTAGTDYTISYQMRKTGGNADVEMRLMTSSAGGSQLASQLTGSSEFATYTHTWTQPNQTTAYINIISDQTGVGEIKNISVVEA
jgi:hypothetical protein